MCCALCRTLCVVRDVLSALVGVTGPVLGLLFGAVRGHALPHITVLSLALRSCAVP